MRLRSLIAVSLTAAILAASAGPAFAIHRSVVVSRGRAWLYDRVPYSQSATHEGYRTDCSGFTSMCWAIGKPGLSTRTLYRASTLTTLGALQPGDAMCYPGHHVFLFLGWANSAHTSIVSLEEASTKLGTISRVRSVSSLTGYAAYRAKNIEADPRWTSRLQFLEGADRYETAAKASAAAFTTAPTVVIAAGLSWADALGASALAGALNGPILLVTKGGLPSYTSKEITRLKAKKAVIVGGTGVVSDTVVVLLRKQGLTVERVAGHDRAGTAAKVAERTVKALGAAKRTWDRIAFVSGQDGWADALVAGALSAKKGWPLFLAERSRLSTETSATLSALRVNRVFILGGSGSVGDGVVGILRGRGITVERWAGADRYMTALVVAAKSAYYGMSWYSVAVASGTSFADATASGPVQAKANSFVLLSPGRYLHPEVAKALVAHRFKPPRIRTLGGDAAVNYEVRHGLYDAAAP
jgi:putative cell wall-binding protein